MGEIGIDRKTFLYDLEWWEIVAITRGYRKRARTTCDMLRWQTFALMNVQADLSKTSINSPEDLIKFTWDKSDEDDIPTDDEVNTIKEELKKLNANRKPTT